MSELEDYLTITKAAQHPDVPYSKQWLKVLCQEGKIKAVKLDEKRGPWLIHLPSLLQYIQEMSDLGTKKHTP